MARYELHTMDWDYMAAEFVGVEYGLEEFKEFESEEAADAASEALCDYEAFYAWRKVQD
jgi:hypothetical protein